MKLSKSRTGASLLAGALSLGAALSGATGCALLERGRTEAVSVRTWPPGAALRVDGLPDRETPAVLRLRRDRDHLVLASHGDVQRVHPIRSERQWAWHLRNLFFLPVFGNLIDLATGADRRLVPTDVEIDLRE